MLQLAEAVQRLVGSTLPLRFEPLPTDDPKQRRPDITKAQRLLNGWEPKIQLAEGLARTLAYFRKQS
jgi:UDP-glucuronate decarboxylase